MLEHFHWAFQKGIPLTVQIDIIFFRQFYAYVKLYNKTISRLTSETT